MNIFLDTEFIDHTKQHRVLGIKVGKPVQTTELISIGMVAEDGKEYYAVCNEFDLDAAWNDQWVRMNVLSKLHEELCARQPTYAKTYHYELFEPFTKKSMRNLIRWHGKSRRWIMDDVVKFAGDKPQFYGYFADYDWVVLCHLFGRMIDLPSHFPMYCRDLKQMMDERGIALANIEKPVNEHNALADARWNMQVHRAILRFQESS